MCLSTWPPSGTVFITEVETIGKCSKTGNTR